MIPDDIDTGLERYLGGLDRIMSDFETIMHQIDALFVTERCGYVNICAGCFQGSKKFQSSCAKVWFEIFNSTTVRKASLVGMPPRSSAQVGEHRRNRRGQRLPCQEG